jgi:hypothetical protein
MITPDSLLTLGMIFTEVLQDHQAGAEAIGQFELPVTIAQKHFMESGDKLGLTKNTIAQHLASAIFDTKVPMYHWRCKVIPEVSREFNIPATFTFEVSR